MYSCTKFDEFSENFRRGGGGHFRSEKCCCAFSVKKKGGVAAPRKIPLQKVQHRFPKIHRIWSRWSFHCQSTHNVSPMSQDIHVSLVIPQLTSDNGVIIVLEINMAVFWFDVFCQLKSEQNNIILISNIRNFCHRAQEYFGRFHHLLRPAKIRNQTFENSKTLVAGGDFFH